MSWDIHLLIAIEEALKNNLAHGDTDIFPVPHIYQHWKKYPQQAIEAVLLLHEHLQNKTEFTKIECIRSFVPAGPTGFRLGTQIEPVSNLYYLALTLLCAPLLEVNRQSIPSGRVHSYRYQSIDSECRIFKPEVGWRSFQLQAKSYGEQFSYVLVCDIADFYRQIKLRAIEHALIHSNCDPELIQRILLFLDLLDIPVNGLPIGGPASRILAEAALQEVDDILEHENIIYCRFVDDIRIFTNSQQVAYQHLLRMNEILYKEGLNLQKSKTRVLTTKEWLAESSFHQAFTPTKGRIESMEDLRTLLMMPSLDPYSEMRAQNDLRLEEFAQKPQALDFLKREFSKSRLHPVMTNHLLSSLQFMSEAECEDAFIWLLDIRRSHHLVPLMSKLLHLIARNFSRLPNPDLLQKAIENLLCSNHYVSKISLHSVLLIRILQLSKGPVKEETKIYLKKLFLASSDILIRSEIIILWGTWNDTQELKELQTHQFIKNVFEQQAFKIAMMTNAF